MNTNTEMNLIIEKKINEKFKRKKRVLISKLKRYLIKSIIIIIIIIICLIYYFKPKKRKRHFH